MSRIVAWVVVVLLVGSMVHGAEPATATSQPAATQPVSEFDRIAEQTITILDAAAAALVPVKDVNTAKEAAGKLVELKKQVDDMRANVLKLGQPSAEVTAATMSKYSKGIETSYLKLAAEGERISKDPALEAIISKPLAELGLVQATVTK